MQHRSSADNSHYSTSGGNERSGDRRDRPHRNNPGELCNQGYLTFRTSSAIRSVVLLSITVNLRTKVKLRRHTMTCPSRGTARGRPNPEHEFGEAVRALCLSGGAKTFLLWFRGVLQHGCEER